MEVHTPTLISNTPKKVEIIKGKYKGVKGITYNTFLDLYIAVSTPKADYMIVGWDNLRWIKDNE